MLRRFFSGDGQSGDLLATVNELLELPAVSGRDRFVLERLCTSLAGDVRGLIISAENPAMIEVMNGYGADFAAMELGAFKKENLDKPQFIEVSELFSGSHEQSLVALARAGILGAKASLLVPIEKSRPYGYLLLQRFDGKFSEPDLKLASQWATLLASSHALRDEASRAKQSLIEFSKAFMEAIESQDFKHLGHAQRVSSYALALGRAKGLPRQELLDLYFAAMLHDVGKLGSGLDLGVEDTNHPQRGANMLASSSLLANAREAIRAHHENWDGTGFPKKLQREQIPLLARIITVADTFDFLSSERGQALPLHEVEKALAVRANKQLDPELVKLFNNILREGKTTKVLESSNQDLFF